jgi:anti-anti-sigma factor
MQAIIAYPKITVIQPYGSFNASKAVEFKYQLTTAISQEEYASVLVDLEQVEFLDSAGLMGLIYGLRLAKALERRFSLCSIPPAIRIILELTQLDQVFEVFESIAAFKAAMLRSWLLGHNLEEAGEASGAGGAA